MSLVSELKTPGAVLQFLDTADGQFIMAYFREQMESSIRQMRRAKELKDIFYAQGAADASEKIADLKKDLKQYLDDVRSGKITPASPDTSKEKKS
jgi:dihydroxyacetone kinase-like predicted kinase